MKYKQFIASLVLATLLTSSVSTVFASEQTVGGTEDSSVSVNVDSEFTSLPTNLSGIIVSLPTNLDLEINDADLTYSIKSTVSAKGTLAPNYILDITVDDTVTYSDSTNNNKLEAGVVFSRISNLGNFHYWTASELLASQTDLDSRDLDISIPAEDVTVAADYNDILTFDISTVPYLTVDKVSESYDFTAGSTDLGDNIYDATLGKVTSSFIANTSGAVEVPKYIKDTSTGLTYLVTTLDGTYSGVSALTSVTIPSSVTGLGASTFFNCTGLTSVTMPDSIKDYTSADADDWANRAIFSSCTNLTSVKLSNNLKTIGYRMFKNCTSLESIVIPDGVTCISLGAFNNCTSLKEITIPSSVTNIYAHLSYSYATNYGTFYNCSSLTDVYYGGTIQGAKSIIFNTTSATYTPKPSLFDTVGYTIPKICSFSSSTSDDLYYLIHATWHCTDGDFVPAELSN